MPFYVVFVHDVVLWSGYFPASFLMIIQNLMH
uniref:Uncharacterized protein n=1 Tax=Rhizophora mucronata TaxID=61149 RepID=A0A2P2NC92_RHIMU